jgi:hypothetical protein
VTFDYEEEHDEPITMPVKIRVENDRRFILSLMQIGAISVLERGDSYLLRPHPGWEEVKQSGGKLQCCEKCLHKIEDPKEWIICPVYNAIVKEEEGDKCGSFAIGVDGSGKEYKGGVYQARDGVWYKGLGGSRMDNLTFR